MKLAKECLIAGILFAVLTLLFAASQLAPVSASQAVPVCRFSDQKGADIAVQEKDGVSYLFLPSSADVTQLKLSSKADGLSVEGSKGSVQAEDGQTIDLTDIAEREADGTYQIRLKIRNGLRTRAQSVTVMQSANISSIHLTSDTEQHGQQWLESDFTRSAKGSVVMLSDSGSCVYDGGFSKLRVRGNTTALNIKKPYQLTLSKSADLLSTGEEDNESKTWLLLANFSDSTLMQNKLLYDLSAEIGMADYMQSDFVDLYYDGVYCGNYLLCEKIEVDAGRVDITDLGTLTDELNAAQGDLDAIASKEQQRGDGSSYRYMPVQGNPDDNTGGYLFEHELDFRYLTEKTGFTSKNGEQFVMKSPEHATQEQMEYISSLWQEFEDAVFAADGSGINPETGQSYDELMDIDSLIRAYLVNELAKNGDGFRTSTFFYKEAGEDSLRAGPVWDFDIACGVWYNKYRGYLQQPEGLLTAGFPLPYQLFQIDSFRQRVDEIYQTELYPAVQDILLGDEDAHGQVLRSIAYYAERLEQSQAMNYRLWPFNRTTSQRVYDAWGGDSYQANVDYLTDFLEQRSRWLKRQYAKRAVDWDPIPEDIPVDCEFFNDYFTVHENGWIANRSQAEFGAAEDAVWEDILPLIYYRWTDGTAVKDGYETAAAWMQSQGVSSADGLNRDGAVAVEQLAAILYQLAGQPEAKYDSLRTYSYRDRISDGYSDALGWAMSNKLVATTAEQPEREPDSVLGRLEACQMVISAWHAVQE